MLRARDAPRRFAALSPGRFFRPAGAPEAAPCAGEREVTRLLANPRAGGGSARRRLGRLAAAARRAGVVMEVPESAAELARAARRAAEDGEARVLVAGGDGTMHWAIQGLAGTRCALGVVPLGSGNDVAREVGSPATLDAALEAALGGPIRSIDLGRAGGRRFATVGGVGIDGAVVRHVDRGIPFVRGPFVYPLAVVRAVLEFRPPRLRLDTDAGTLEERVVLASAANLPWFGGGMRIAPDARADDGLFDLVLVRAISPLRLLWVLPRVYSGAHVTHPAVRVIRTRSVRIASDRPLDLQADGEILGRVHAEAALLEVVPGDLRVVDSRVGITIP
jgi:diacylglycerol kinase (ATP)